MALFYFKFDVMKLTKIENTIRNQDDYINELCVI